MSTSMTAEKSGFKPALWTPGDWNAFFGFGTNILVNMLVLTGLLRFVLKMPDYAGVRPHPAGARADDVPVHLLLCVAGLPAGAEDRTQRCLRAALGRQRAAHVHRHLRDHAADHHQDRRSHEGLVGRPGLGVLPELHPDDRRLHRALYPEDHAARRPARHARRRVGHLHLDAAGARNVHDAADRPGLLCHHPGELVRRREISARGFRPAWSRSPSA